MTLVNVSCPWAVGTPANKDAIIATMEHSHEGVQAILHENWGYPNQGSSEIVHDNQLHSFHYRQPPSMDAVLQMADTNRVRMSSSA
jgi:hypothetical protein